MRKGLKNSFIILGIGLLSAAIPFGYMSVIFGSPSVIICTILVSIVFRKELGY